jgi:hypothetical protein
MPCARTLRWIAAVTALALCACTSVSSPTIPETPGSGSGVVRNGVTEQVVAAQVDPSSARVGDRITVTAAGFLTREQRREAADVFLWPGDRDYIREIAYWEFTDDSLRTIRWTAGFTITFEGDLGSDPVRAAKAREVAAEASRHIGLPVSVGSGGAVTIGLDLGLDSQDAVAEASVDTTGAVITGARIVFINRDEIANGPRAQYTNTFLHELGHVIGLGHSISVRDVMTPAEGPGTFEQAYQPGEAGALHMIYAHRRAGNIFPDRDPAFGAASAAPPNRFVIRD